MSPAAPAPSGMRRIFRAWEKLRVVYVVVLGIAAVGTMVATGQVDRWADPVLWGWFAIYALVANVLYLAGPAFESYLDWLGWRPRGLRVVLFLAGTLLAMGLTGGTVYGMAWMRLQ